MTLIFVNDCYTNTFLFNNDNQVCVESSTGSTRKWKIEIQKKIFAVSTDVKFSTPQTKNI